MRQSVQARLTDGSGNATLLTANRFGASLTQTDALGRFTQITRDANNLPTQVTRPNGAVVTMTYDARGNLLTSTEQAINSAATFTYEPTFSQVTSITDPRGNRTTLAYDPRGNPTTITDALGQVTTLAYDARGLLTSTRDALGNTTTFTYDAKGILTTTTDPLGRVTSLTYDAAGNVLSSTDPLGRVTRFTYDAHNRLTGVTDAAGGLTRYTNDPKGNLLSVSDARGQVTTFSYNAVDQLIQTTNPLGHAKTFTYGLARNLTLVVDAKGQRVEFTYDAGNQLVQKVLKDVAGVVTDTVTLSYDLLGNLATATDSNSSLTFTYDPLGRLTQAQTGATVAQPASTLTYTYDLAGNRLTMTDPQGGATSYAYDPLNRLATLTSPQGTTTLAYDALSRRTSLTLPNGSRASYAYDVASQLTRLLNQGPGASPVTLADFAYTYDAVGNRATRSTLQGIASYTYDALNRLTQASQPDPIDPLRQVTEAFAYDPVGNRTASHLATGQVHDAANRLLEDSTFTYTYDANGNLTAKTARPTGATTTYTYDAENRLTRVQTPTLTALYRYDPLGRRITKEVTQAGTPTSTRYIYDNEDILLELDGANTVQTRYTHGPGIDEPLIMLRGTQAFFYHPDGLGSVWDLTDAAGSVGRSYTYDSFGNLLAQPGTLPNPYTYTGREVDPEAGLYYYRARYYDPTTGHFLQEDPLHFFGGDLNLYRYVQNNPVNWTDPLGLEKGRYRICEIAPCPESLCKSVVDFACRRGLAHCCKVDYDDCVLKLIGQDRNDPEIQAAYWTCYAAYTLCAQQAGLPPPPPEPWTGRDPKGYGDPYPSPPGRGPKIPNQPGKPWRP